MPELKTMTPKDYATDIHNDWCPGCGDFGILSAIQTALAELQIPSHKVACISGIGCSGKTPHYINTYGFHTLHGRVLPCVTGIKLANPTLTVIGVGGDGDAYGIGGGHFVAGGRRNLDFTYVVFNNDVYALTKGQGSPTMEKGKKTKSMPEPSIFEAINPVALALASGYTFVARGFALDTKHLASLIKQGIEHKGSALIDVYQTCPTYNDLHTRGWYMGKDRDGKSRLTRLEELGYDPRVKNPDNQREVVAKKLQAIEKGYNLDGELHIGVLFKIGVPTLEDNYAAKLGSIMSHPLAEQKLWERDVTPLLEKLV